MPYDAGNEKSFTLAAHLGHLFFRSLVHITSASAPTFSKGLSIPTTLETLPIMII